MSPQEVERTWRELKPHYAGYLLMFMLMPHAPTAVTTEWLVLRSTVSAGTVRKAGNHLCHLGIVHRLERNGTIYWQVQNKVRQLSLFSQMLGTGNAGMLSPATGNENQNASAPILLNAGASPAEAPFIAPKSKQLPVNNPVDNFEGGLQNLSSPMTNFVNVVEGDKFCHPSKKERKIDRKNKYSDQSIFLSNSSEEDDKFCHTPTSKFAERIGITDFDQLADCSLPYALAHWWFTQAGGKWGFPQGYVFKWAKLGRLAKPAVKPFYDLAVLWVAMNEKEREYVLGVILGSYGGVYQKPARTVSDMKWHFEGDFYPDVPDRVWATALRCVDFLGGDV